MNTLQMIKAGIHPLQHKRSLEEGIIDFFKKGLSTLADILAKPYEILREWTTQGTVGDLASSLSGLADRIFRAITEEYDKKDLEAVGSRMANLLIHQKFLTEGDDEKEFAFYMFLDSMGIDKLVDFLKAALPPDLSDNDVKQAGYWMLKTIVKDIKKRPSDMRVAAYISGTEEKDVNSIFDVYGDAVYTATGIHPSTSNLSQINVTAGQVFKSDNHYERFLWIQDAPVPTAYWLVLDKNDKLSYAIKNPDSTAYNGKIYVTLDALCKLVDKRRYRKFALVYNDLCFRNSKHVVTNIEFAIKQERLPKIRKNWSSEHELEARDLKIDGEMREGRDCLGTAKGYKNTDFAGFYKIVEDDAFEIGVF